MLKRNIKITFRLNEKEHQSLTNQVKKTGLSQESFIRALIKGYEPRELPPPDYHGMIRELHAIGGNLNQIAAGANAIGHIDSMDFQSEVNWLRRAVLDIQKAVTGPHRGTIDDCSSLDHGWLQSGTRSEDIDSTCFKYKNHFSKNL